MNSSSIKEIKNIYFLQKKNIISRLSEFKQIWEKGNNIDVFTELTFCLLTPQSKAKSCWNAVCSLTNKNLLFKGNQLQISNELNSVRFKNNKAKYIILAREQLTLNGKIVLKSKIEQLKNEYDKREWLVKNVKGIGYKEASHFLRNIGFGENIAILDRHILKNLKNIGIIKDIPKSLTKQKYFEIEKKMQIFAEKIGIPVNHLDLIMWCKETGEIFK
ncbi:N-glycosylase/DNA lyase [Candidatus Poribacteria bacterium]|nr:N-glycosylase/DNA lyase [Candidatus Poribacteria bacterium]